MANETEDELNEYLRDLEQEAQQQGARAGLLPDSVRKLFVTGLSAVFMTEEGIRGVLSEMRLPKDAIASLLQQTERSRRELLRLISDELKRYLRAVDLPGEIRKALTGMRLEVNAQIRFVEDEESRSSVSAKVHDDTETSQQHAEPQAAKGAEQQSQATSATNPRRRPKR